jgi:drug/metabolite transporter (DMT)-like permease
MTDRTIATLVGLSAAFLFALAAYYQQRAARATVREGRTVVGGAYRLMSQLVRSRIWLLGWLVNLVGFAAQAVALHIGSVALVQPLLATQLLFAMPMASLERRTWPQLRDWAAALCICVGLVLLLGVVHVVPLDAAADRSRVVLAALAAVVVICVLMSIAARMRTSTMVLVASACAGLCFAMTAVFIKLTADDLVHHGVGYTARDWVGYALAGSTLLGLVLEQVAFANGSLPWAVAAKESVNPIAGFTVGVLAFPVALPADPGTVIGMTFAGLLLVAGAIGLAGSPSADLWLRRSDQASSVPAR